MPRVATGQNEDLEVLEDSVNAKDGSGMLVIRIGLFLTFYFREGHLPEVRRSLVACFEDYWKMCGSRLHWAPQNGRWVRLDGRATVPTPRETAAGTGPSDPWQFLYHGGQTVEEASHYRFLTFCTQNWATAQGDLSFLTAAFPLTFFAHRAEELPDVVHRWASWLRPFHGYAGLGFIESLDNSVAVQHQPEVYALARRYPGLEADYPIPLSLTLGRGIKGVNWLTILSDHWLDQVGGLEALRSQLGPEFVFREYPRGVVIQAGPMPNVGDRSRKRWPPLYVKLNALLRPIRVQEVYPFHKNWHEPPPRFDPDASTEYLARFDERR